MIYIYSILVILLMPCAYVLSFFSSRIRRFFSQDRQTLNILSKLHPTKPRRAFFFCSSAGEFEQAKPLIDALKNSFDIHVFFFSPSGINFAKARKETISYSLTPIDTIWNWQRIFAAWKPEICILVRHELWPAFLHVAAKESRLVLINYSNMHKASVWQRCLLKKFRDIMCINQLSAKTLNFLNSQVIHITGDTKADRAFERAVAKKSESLPQAYRTENFLNLVVGSAWEADIAVVGPAFQKTLRGIASNWRLTICPHDIDSENIRQVVLQIHAMGLRTRLLSEWSQVDQNDLDVIVIVDKLGILAELYSIADAAFVGGGLHYRVHNVLEPAVYGCPMAFGPLYKNSPEACHFVDENCATVVESVDDCIGWISKIQQGNESMHKQVHQSAEKLRGGTGRILALLE